MTQKNRVVLVISLFTILIGLGVLIWANQTHKLTIWGDSASEEEIARFHLGTSISINDSRTTGCWDPSWEAPKKCFKESLNLSLTSDIISRHTRAEITPNWSFDDVGHMNLENNNHNYTLGGQYSDKGFACKDSSFRWMTDSKTNNITGYIDWYGINTLSYTAMDCRGTFVGGALDLVIYGTAAAHTPTVKFDNSNITIANGSGIIGWTSTYANSATLTGPDLSVTVSPNGTRTISKAGVYTITVTGDGGNANATAVATVQEGVTPTVHLSAVETSVNKGTKATLVWSSSNATSLSIDNGIGTVSGNGTIETPIINSQTTFIITARGSDTTKVAQSQATINIKDSSDNQPPSAPANLIGLASSCSNIHLSWDTSSDNSGVIDHYEIYNADADSAVYVNRTSDISWDISGLSCATTHKYYVKAFDATGNQSLPSNTAEVTTSSGGNTNDTTPPTKPTNLVAASSECHGVKLTWTASTDNSRTSGIGYDIFDTSKPDPITTTDKTEYTISGLSEKSTFNYYIKAHDAAKNPSEESNHVSINTISCGSGGGINTNTGGTTLSISKLVATGQLLWLNILIAFIIAGGLSFFIIRKSNKNI